MNWPTARIILFWGVLLAALYRPIRNFSAPFPWKTAIANLEMLKYRKGDVRYRRPRVPTYSEQQVDDALGEWGIKGPIYVALPAMYWHSELSLAGFLTSFSVQAEAYFYNGPFPHPKLEVQEHFAGPPPGDPYFMENRSANAVLVLQPESGFVLPLGYTAWYDFFLSRRDVPVKTPRLVDASGSVLRPVAVRAVHPLNSVEMGGEWTYFAMRHYSPIVWTFPGSGRLQKSENHFAVEEIVDGAEVSWLPDLPTNPHDHTFGLFALAPLLPAWPADQSPPAWWNSDEQLRHAIVKGAPWPERRRLLATLTAQFPDHPLLPHYRVVARLGSDEFDSAWLAAQARGCDRPTWYLLPWTHLSWSRVRDLPCMKVLADYPDGSEYPEYLGGPVVMAFRQLRDDPTLKSIATRVIRKSFLFWKYRVFNYVLSDLAWLWLHQD